ncbi:MAG: hypothetical protein AAFY41_11990, partial [Bacteroidota bacterium]
RKKDLITGYIETFRIPSNGEIYLDESCFVSGREYEYQISGYDSRSVLFGSSNKVRITMPVEWYESWSKDFDQIFTAAYQGINRARVGNMFENEGDVLFITSTRDKHSNYPFMNYRIIKFDKTSGEVRTDFEPITSHRSEIFGSAVKIYDNNFFFTHNRAEQAGSYNEFLHSYKRGETITDHYNTIRGFNKNRGDHPKKLINVYSNELFFFTSEIEASGTYLNVTGIKEVSGGSPVLNAERRISSPYDGYINSFQDAMVVRGHSVNLLAVYKTTISGKDRIIFWQGLPSLSTNEVFSSYDKFDKVDNLKLVSTEGRKGLLIGNTGSSNREFFITELDNFREIQGESLSIYSGSSGSSSSILKVIKRSEDEYVIVMASNSGISPHKSKASTGFDIWLFAVDSQGRKLWERTLDYDYANLLFDASFIDRHHLIVGGVRNKDDNQINLKMFTSFPNYQADKSVCEGAVDADETFAEYGKNITVSNNCDVSFNAGSSTLLKASSSIR